MKIIYCIAGTYNSGGMERVLANKANYLVGHGHEVSIITTDQCEKPSYFPLDGRVRCYDLSINYEENNGKSFLNKLCHYPIKQKNHQRRLTELLKLLKADLVISMFCNDASFLWKVNDGSKKVLEIHFSRYKRMQYGRKGIWKLADRLRSWMDLQTVTKYDQFVVLTHEDKAYWGHLPHIRVIPNALTFSVTQPSTLTPKKVIAIGRYNYQKGFDELIDTWAIVYRSHPEWELDIIGNGECRDDLQKQIDEYSLTGNVHLKPPTKRIGEVYQQASMLVMTSRYEGLPMVLLEAQSFGLPIVSYACQCGPRDVIVDGENGFLLYERNPEMLAHKIIEIIEDEQLRVRMGQAAYAHSQRFSEPMVMRQWEDLFSRLLNKCV